MRFAIWHEQVVDGECCRTTSRSGRRCISGFVASCAGYCSARSATSPLKLDRERERREQSPTAAVVDSQSIKAPAAESRGIDAGKKVVGRKRHIAVDTDDRLLMVNLTTADIFDSVGAQAIVAAVRRRWPWLKHLFADGAYDRTRLMDAVAYQDFLLKIIRRSDKEPGFKVLPRRCPAAGSSSAPSVG